MYMRVHYIYIYTMYVCMYVCTYVCMYVRTYVRMYVCIVTKCRPCVRAEFGMIFSNSAIICGEGSGME